MSELTDRQRALANELYWKGEQTVDDVADAVGITRSALYGVVRPLPAEIACTECGAGMAFANRRARDAGEIRCLECGVTSAATPGSPAADDSHDRPTAEDGGDALPRPEEVLEGDEVAAERLRRVAAVAGGAALGLLAGGAAAAALRNRP